MVWVRWIGAIMGIALLLVDPGFNLLGPKLHGFAEIVKDNVKYLGIFLLALSATKEMVPGLIRIGAIGVTTLATTALVRTGGGFGEISSQALWLTALCGGVVFLSEWLPTRSRRIAYGAILAFAWVAVGAALVDGHRLGAGWTIFIGILGLIVLMPLTAVFKHWARTGQPSPWVLERFGFGADEDEGAIKEPRTLSRPATRTPRIAPTVELDKERRDTSRISS